MRRDGHKVVLSLLGLDQIQFVSLNRVCRSGEVKEKGLPKGISRCTVSISAAPQISTSRQIRRFPSALSTRETPNNLGFAPLYDCWGPIGNSGWLAESLALADCYGLEDCDGLEDRPIIIVPGSKFNELEPGSIVL